MKDRRSVLALLLSAVIVVGLTTLAGGCGKSGAPEEAASTDRAVTPAEEAPPEAPPVSPPAPPRPRASRPAAPAPERSAEEAPARPRPEPVIHTVTAGTVLDVEFLDGVSSRSSQAGDIFRARLAKDVAVEGTVVIPAGSIVKGTVTEAVSLKKIGGTARLALDFNRLELPSGEVVPIVAGVSQAGKSETAKDAGTIAGATAGGAILGRLLSKKDKGKGTVIGAIVGGAAGTAIAAKTKGEEIDIPPGTQLKIQLSEPAKVTVLH